MPDTTSRASARMIPILAIGLVFIFAIVTIQFAGSFNSELGPLPVDNSPRNPPFVSTPVDIVDDVVALANIEQKALVYDLGCGDGRLAIEAAKKHGCRVIGFDIDSEAVQLARDNVRNQNLEHLVEIRKQDVLTLDLSNVDVVLMYLLPEFNKQLIPEFQKMKPGSRIVSHEFPVDPYPADETKTVCSQYDGSDHVIYLWRGPFPMEPQSDDIIATGSNAESGPNKSSRFSD